MGIILKKGRNGKLRRHWYGKYEMDGETKVINLAVPVKGTPPATLRGKSDDKAFEQSRTRAETALEKYIEEVRQKGRAEHLTERLIESKTGERVEYVKVADLGARWRAGSPACEKHLKHTDATFRDFAAYVDANQPEAVFCYAVTRKTVEGFADHLRKDLAPATSRRKLRLLKGAFARALPIGARNPFDPLPWVRGAGAGEEVHRRPLTPEERERLFEAARRDPFMLPLVTAAAWTGMRRGDVCRLRWAAVNLAEGILAVRTDKTGARVEIPILEPLRAVLETAQASRKPGAVYVWPQAAQVIEKTPNILTRMFKKLAVEAFTVVPPVPQLPAAPAIDRVKLADVLPAVEKALLAGLPEGARLIRVLDNVRRYAKGETVRGIEKETGRSRGQISEDLHMAEKLGGLHFMPDVPRVAIRTEVAIADATRQARPHGKRVASIIDWPCLRTTFVTIALSKGVPMELVRLVTGHRTVEVVLKYYYRPQRAQLRNAFYAAFADDLPAVKPAAVSPRR
jgi:integrase